jgi:hypothetical protein
MGRFVCAALVAAVCASAASANMGPPWIGGRVVAEPDGMKGVRVLHETLVIDMRPVARGEFAHVEATYRFRNDGPARQLELLFATGANEIAGFTVTLDGAPIPSAPRDVGELPKSWQPPKTTPGLNGHALEYGPKLGGSDLKTVGFTLAVSQGEHTVRVSYHAPASKNMSGYPVAYQQFAYVLAPAKSWDGFGKLEVTVYVPEGWAAASEPALTRDGDTLRATFDGIPADALALTLQAPAGRGFVVAQVVLWVVFGLLCVATAWWVWLVGRKEGRRRDLVRIFVIGGAVAVAAHFILSVGFTCTLFGMERALPAQQVGGQTPTGGVAILVAVYMSALVVPAFAAFAVGTGLVVRHLNRPVPPS